MIAIYDQERITLDSVDAVFIQRNSSRKKISTAMKGQPQINFPVVATYDTESQAQYVLDQIALAIERGDKLYRMPSVEEVERRGEKIPHDGCEGCKHQDLKGEEYPCSVCQQNYVDCWQPKEQEVEV